MKLSNYEDWLRQRLILYLKMKNKTSKESVKKSEKKSAEIKSGLKYKQGTQTKETALKI